MEQINKLRINSDIIFNGIGYKISNIEVVKMGKCFRNFYGNNYLFELTKQSDNNDIINLTFNGKNIHDYIIVVSNNNVNITNI